MGAGRIVEQEIVRVDKLIESGELFRHPALLSATEQCKRLGSAFHLMGLVQDQGVHATEEHLYALLELARREGLSRVFVHFFSDGRDTPPRSALVYLDRLERKIAELGVGTVASVIGRYYAMDRALNWDRTARAYNALVHGEGLAAPSARAAIEAAYARADRSVAARAAGGGEDTLIETDEFIQPTLIIGADGRPLGTIRAGDARGALQLSAGPRDPAHARVRRRARSTPSSAARASTSPTAVSPATTTSSRTSSCRR